MFFEKHILQVNFEKYKVYSEKLGMHTIRDRRSAPPSIGIQLKDQLRQCKFDHSCQIVFNPFCSARRGRASYATRF
jgi:hypothetical protein